MAKSRVFRPLYIIPILVVALIGVLWWVNHQQEVPGGNSMQRYSKSGGGGGHHGFMMNGPMPVVAVPATKGDINLYFNGLGTVTPITTVTVRTQVSGQLVKVNYIEGQEVKKGFILAEIDPRPYQNSLATAKGQLMQAQAQLKEAQLNLQRYKDLASQDSIAQQQVDTQAALVTQDEGIVNVDQAAIDSANLNLTYCKITAPVDGRVGLRLVDAGNYVTPGDSTGIVVLTQQKPITVIFSLPEDNIPEVAQRLHDGATIPVDAYDRTVTKKLASGKLATFDNEVDPSTGTFKLKAIFDNNDETLFPSQFVNARMLLDVLHGVTVISTSAIERGEQGTFVYVVTKPDNTVTAKTISLGATEGEKVQVTKGINDGDLVVIDGADKLKEGMEVTVQTPEQAIPSTGVPADADQRSKYGKGGKGGKGKYGGKGKGKRPDGSAAPSSSAPSAASS